MKKNIISSLAFIISTLTFAQIGIGTNTPASSSLLDLTSNSKGLLLPRVASTAAITAPANGLIIYDLSSNCIKVYRNSAWSDCLSTPAPAISYTCKGFNGSYCTSALSGTTYKVTITNNDLTAKQFTPQTSDLVLYGITGLTVSTVSPNTATTINPGTSLEITYTISGTPGSSGNLTGTFIRLGQYCSNIIAVQPSKIVTPVTANPVIAINYTITKITHTTTNATGIGTATGLPSGVTAVWANNTISINGTPTTFGTYNYSIPVNGPCGSAVNATGTITVTCGAYAQEGVPKAFMCHNLGADTSLDPNIPVQAIHGNYYQWGTAVAIADAYTPEGEISSWRSWTATPLNAWLDTSKTANDPCPAGYRVPTSAEWQGVATYNSISRTGPFDASNTNFGSAIHFGPNSSNKTLTLTASGFRSLSRGNLFFRGSQGYYYSSTLTANSTIENKGTMVLSFQRTGKASTGGMGSIQTTNALSIRCMSE